MKNWCQFVSQWARDNFCSYRKKSHFTLKNEPNPILYAGSSDYKKSQALTHLSSTVAHRGHRFNKEKTLQIKEFLANIKNTSKKINPCTQKTKKETVKKKYAHCKQNNCTLQTKLPHTANKKNPYCQKLPTTSKRITRCKQNSRTLQIRKKLHKEKYCTLQAKELHTANKTPTRCKQKQK